ncbi:lactococcin 972 family bacteriocin [Kitasatospora sp. NPDC089509]|uniref:lactococcin 972 family bacteriocin n=1 Tax=Kitasatospora sp. NPDC089509 TaxID=3364079 RepID=UPI0037F4910A
MKKSAGRLAFGAFSAVVTAGILVPSTPAVAAAVGPVAPRVEARTAAAGETPPAALIGPNGEKPVVWGSVSFDEGSGPVTRENVGGGTWQHGSMRDGGYKKCYSNYTHPTKKHSASVAISDLVNKDIQEADNWARASATSGWAYKCNAYWGLY